MSNEFMPKHKIQKHILDTLMYQKYARFRDMRPPGVDTNLYSYHLKILQHNSLVIKSIDGYTLGANGLTRAHHAHVRSHDSMQPVVGVSMVIQNSNGDVLLQRSEEQPFIDTWALPSGITIKGDLTIKDAARRVAHETLCLQNLTLRHVGDCYVRVSHESQVIMSQLMHVFRFEADITAPNSFRWARPHRLDDYELAPGVEQIITRAFFNDPYFFEEFAEAL